MLKMFSIMEILARRQAGRQARRQAGRWAGGRLKEKILLNNYIIPFTFTLTTKSKDPSCFLFSF